MGFGIATKARKAISWFGQEEGDAHLSELPAGARALKLAGESALEPLGSPEP